MTRRKVIGLSGGWGLGAGASPKRLALAVLFLLAASFGAASTPAAAATSLEVTAGWSGFFVPGRAVPMRVTVTADRLLQGHLLARTAGRDREAVRLPVEVAGGSVKRFMVVLPPGAADGNAVRVELRSGGRTLARGDAPLQSATGTELVGLLPGALAGRPVPGAAALAVDAGLARFAALEPADVTRGPMALDALSTVAVAAGELAALAPSARTGLLAWVAAGGRLLIDGLPGDTVPGLPADWTPGASGRAVAGRGEVRLTGDAISAGRWAGLVEPTPLGRNVSEDFFSGDMVANSVARDAGLRLPGLAMLLGFLAVYVLAVGPLTAFVLRRRRRPELAWVVVPALAVAFTVASYAAGSHGRDGTHIAHGSVVQTQGDSSVATTFVGLARSGAGSAHVGFPAGWTVRPAPDGSGRSRPPVIDQADTGPEAELPLDLGQFGFVKASGPTRLPGALEVTAAADGDGAGGTVRNGLPYTLDEVAVFLGSGVTHVGRLGPGEERTWSIGDPFSGPVLGPEWFRRFPGDFSSGGGGRRQGPVSMALWQATRAELGADLSAPGSAVAVAWTRSFRPEIRLDGKPRSLGGRTALLARAPVTAPAGSAPTVAVARQVLRGPFPTGFGWAASSGPDETTVLRFTLPDQNARPLVLRSSGPLQSVEVWRDGAWQQLGPAGVPAIAAAGAGGLPAGAEVAIPDGAVSGGVAFVRLLRGNLFDDGSGLIVTLGQAS